jgi:hypothetical protein
MTGIPFHTFANAFPLMDGREFTEFVDDIKAHGQREPITTYQGQILEGRNRYRACLRLKIEPQCVEFEGDDAAAHAFVISRNVHRRHLKPKDKREAIAKLLKLQPEKSDRMIAKAAGVDHKTVAKVRREAQSTGEIPQLKSTVGADGKKRKQPAVRTERSGRSAAAAARDARKRDKAAREKWREEAEAEATKLATALIALDPAYARALNKFFGEGGDGCFVDAIHEVLWQLDHPSSGGNDADPEQAAEQRKREFAALDAGADCGRAAQASLRGDGGAP